TTSISIRKGLWTLELSTLSFELRTLFFDSRGGYWIACVSSKYQAQRTKYRVLSSKSQRPKAKGQTSTSIPVRRQRINGLFSCKLFLFSRSILQTFGNRG